MKKFTMLFVCLAMLSVQVVNAQQRTITGKVTSSEDGMSLPGVSVSVKGTTTGTITNADGAYTLGVAADAQALVFSFVGMSTKEVVLGSTNMIDVVLDPEVIGVDEVIVTALGISRDKKSLGYAVQEVHGDELVQTKDPNIISSLSGKVAGVQVTGSGGTMGGSTRILIRGASSISNSNNQPLYVVDGVVLDNQDFNSANTQRGGGGYDFGSMAQDINPEDIETLTVLRGANATALYGSRAANGAIIITTKKGEKSETKHIGVDFSYGLTMENVAVLPKYQTKYGGGSIFDTPNGFDQIDINGTTYNGIDYGTDESWGPEYDPNIQYVPYWSLYDWEDAGKPNTALETVPWTAPANGVEDFFETGITHNTSVAISGGDKSSAFRIGYTNLKYDGYMPGTEMDRNAINVNVSKTFIDIVDAFSTVNFIKTDALGRPESGYGDNNIMVRFSQWGQTQLDMEKAKDYKQSDGTQRSWNRLAYDNPNPHYSNNPYWSRYEDYENDSRNHLFGNIGAKVKITDWLSVQGKINMDYYNFRVEERIAINSMYTPYYGQTLRERTELNKELLIFVKKDFGDFGINATFGANQMDQTFASDLMETQEGLVTAGLYNISNSAGNPFAEQVKNAKRVNSLFASASFDYISMLFVDLTLRNDWSTSLPEKNESYMYPSVTGSFVFTELAPLKNNSILSFGKLRLGWAKVGNDTEPYSFTNVYKAEPLFGTSPSNRLSTILNTPDLKSESTYSWEIGTDMNFLKGRAFVDFTYYSQRTEDAILEVATSSTTGYRNQLINAGEITNQGIELMVGGTPVKLSNGFEWEIMANFSRNRNEVVKLTDDLDSYRHGTGLFGIEIHAMEGKSLGEIKGGTYVKDDNGNIVIGTDGRYLNGDIESVGSIFPDYNLGITNTFRFKGFDFGFLLDYQKGGSIFSLTNMWGTYSGILEETAVDNANGMNVRDDVADGGGVLNSGVYGSVNADGSITYLDAAGNESATPIANETYISAARWSADHYSRARADQNTFDASYFKLREMHLGYTIPTKFTGPIKSINVSIFGRNLGMWGTDCKHIDPETTTNTGNLQGIEGGQLPTLRSFGFNLSFKF